MSLEREGATAVRETKHTKPAVRCRTRKPVVRYSGNPIRCCKPENKLLLVQGNVEFTSNVATVIKSFGKFGGAPSKSPDWTCTARYNPTLEQQVPHDQDYGMFKRPTAIYEQPKIVNQDFADQVNEGNTNNAENADNPNDDSPPKDGGEQSREKSAPLPTTLGRTDQEARTPIGGADSRTGSSLLPQQVWKLAEGNLVSLPVWQTLISQRLWDHSEQLIISQMLLRKKNGTR